VKVDHVLESLLYHVDLAGLLGRHHSRPGRGDPVAPLVPALGLPGGHLLRVVRRPARQGRGGAPPDEEGHQVAQGKLEQQGAGNFEGKFPLNEVIMGHLR